MKNLLIELRIWISDTLLSWSFSILPEKSRGNDKEKLAHLLIKRYDGKKYGLVVSEEELNDSYQAFVDLGSKKEHFISAVKTSIANGKVENIKSNGND